MHIGRQGSRQGQKGFIEAGAEGYGQAGGMRAGIGSETGRRQTEIEAGRIEGRRITALHVGHPSPVASNVRRPYDRSGQNNYYTYVWLYVSGSGCVRACVRACMCIIIMYVCKCVYV